MQELRGEREDTLQAILAQNVILSAPTSRSIAQNQSSQIDERAEHLQIDLQNRREKQKYRQQWNLILGCLVIIGFFFCLAVILLIGRGYLLFDKFSVPAVIAGGVLETYGLAKLAVSYFFSEDGYEKARRGR